ncbi:MULTISPECIES: ComEC/Rec2 family competence protein [Vibrio oreintalis group]|uniref:ComEC/Rec2 family competence protein n=1 Tax=Vibrio oreintalis group TaxID=1891919 RepID=UPI00234EB459|nr:MBL fold metallo-hydrolase [Vibrio tubiashii]WCP70305.1 MBL fold metallo-hydrolase [Vibrio tubiashii]
MGYEVDFHAVGEQSKSGDAISMRITDDFGQSVIVIDGGYKDDGKVLAAHIEKHYGTNIVDLMISTHPDSDHINGLFHIIENLEVKKLLISKPWEFDNLSEHFSDGRFTDNSLGDKIAESLNKAVDLVSLAEKNDVEVITPRAGMNFMFSSAQLVILGPSEEYYKELLPQILDEKPAEKTEVSMEGFLKSALDAVIKKIAAIWGKDNLSEDVETSPLNSTSIITLVNCEGRSSLFTGDSGVEALKKASNLFENWSTGNTLRLFQVPHHGSRRNISSEVLNSYIGPHVDKGESRGISAICSAAKMSDKHPRDSVVNALWHRGAKVLATKGSSIRHHHGMGTREGWDNPVEPIEYFDEVEA